MSDPGAPTLHRTWLRRRGQGDPVVMIHGFGGDHNAWRMLVAAAALPRPVLAIDLPGHGQSTAEATEFAAIVDAVAAAIELEGCGAIYLAGHSLGAAVAVGVARSGRVDVRSLFLIAPAGLGPEINQSFLTGFCAARSEQDLAPALALLVTDPASLPPVFVAMTAQIRAMPGVADRQQLMAESLFPQGRQSFSVRPHLDGIAIPVTVVFGSADRIIPAAHMDGLPPAIGRHVLPGIGHLPLVEAADATATLLTAHLPPD